jgi:hypothetical protein
MAVNCNYIVANCGYIIVKYSWSYYALINDLFIPFSLSPDFFTRLVTYNLTILAIAFCIAVAYSIIGRVRGSKLFILK